MINKIKDCIEKDSLIIDEGPRVLDINGKSTGKLIKAQNSIVEEILTICDRDDVKVILDNGIDCWELTNFTIDGNLIKDVLYGIEDDDEVNISIHIEKNIKNNKVSIYSIQSFYKWLLEKDIQQSMSIFSDLLRERENIIFEMLYNDSFLCTETIIFKGKGTEYNKINFNRLEQLEKCKSASGFYSINEYTLVPEDFNVIYSSKDNLLCEIFEKIKMILSLAYIANTCNILKNELIIHITGQRNFDTTVPLNKNDINYNNEFYKMYKWIYIEGNPIDKAIIARNLISLHCKFSNILNIDNTIFASIKSNYELYQRNNVTQYLELKNKMSDYILETCNNINNISDHLIDRFKNNIFSFFAFMITVFLGNLLSDSPLNNIFTPDVVGVIYLVLLGSLVYLIISIIEVEQTTKRLDKTYYKLKDNYGTILDLKDIEEVFKDDAILDESKNEVKKIKNIIIMLWISLIVFAFIITFALGIINNNKQVHGKVFTRQTTTSSMIHYK